MTDKTTSIRVGKATKLKVEQKINGTRETITGFYDKAAEAALKSPDIINTLIDKPAIDKEIKQTTKQLDGLIKKTNKLLAGIQKIPKKFLNNVK